MSETTATVNPIKIDIDSDIKKILREIGESAVDDLKANSPVGATGDYRNGWTYELDADGKGVSVYNDVRSYNRYTNQTTSLELGHAWSKNGKSGHTRGKMHIKPAFERTKRKYESELEQIKLTVK